MALSPYCSANRQHISNQINKIIYIEIHNLMENNNGRMNVSIRAVEVLSCEDTSEAANLLTSLWLK